MLTRIRHRRIASALVGLAILVALVVVDEVAFQALFETDFVRWYLANGLLIGLIMTFVTLAWGDLNKVTHLISAHPFEYAGAWLSLGGLPPLTFAAMFRQGTRRARMEARLERALAGAPADTDVPSGLWLDFWFTAFFAVALVLAYFAFLLVVVPLQYFVFLVTGAPARAACNSQTRVWYQMMPESTTIAEAWKWAAKPDGATESGFSAKPVAFTAAVTTAVLFAVSRLL
jgi:hypothetical protein